MSGENLLVLLERRLDNVVYRSGFADSRAQARQLVQHGHLMVNGRRVTIPSILVRPNDVVEVRPESRKRTYFKERAQIVDGQGLPNWLQMTTADNLSFQVGSLPRKEDIELPVDEQLVVGFYSR